MPNLPAVCLAAALLSSCAARRTLSVTSSPAGAEVWLDGEHVGTTPVEIEFDHYGTRRVTLLLAGYAAYSEQKVLDPPWYGVFPLDIVFEVLLPIGWEDSHEVHVDLVEGEEVLSLPTLRSVLDRAEFLRRAGPSGPRKLPPVETSQVARQEKP